MRLPLVYLGDPLLRKKCRKVEHITSSIRKLVGNMVETMDKEKGVGIAAPQIGEDLQIFVLRKYGTNPTTGQKELSSPHVYINPRILAVSKETCMDQEGCLSIPGLQEEVERFVQVKIEAQDMEGRLFIEEVEGFNARVIQHEYDHLQGILFTDRLSKEKQQLVHDFLTKVIETYNPQAASKEVFITL